MAPNPFTISHTRILPDLRGDIPSLAGNELFYIYPCGILDAISGHTEVAWIYIKNQLIFNLKAYKDWLNEKGGQKWIQLNRK